EGVDRARAPGGHVGEGGGPDADDEGGRGGAGGGRRIGAGREGGGGGGEGGGHLAKRSQRTVVLQGVLEIEERCGRSVGRGGVGWWGVGAGVTRGARGGPWGRRGLIARVWTAKRDDLWE